MTEAQELMLAVCFGSCLGIQVFNVGLIIKFVIDTVKEKKLKTQGGSREGCAENN